MSRNFWLERAAAAFMEVEDLLSLDDTSRRSSLSKRAVMNRVKRGEFPEPVYLGAARPAFITSEIDAWIADRIAERDAGVLPPGRAELIASRRRGGATRAEMMRRLSPNALTGEPTSRQRYSHQDESPPAGEDIRAVNEPSCPTRQKKGAACAAPLTHQRRTRQKKLSETVTTSSSFSQQTRGLDMYTENEQFEQLVDSDQWRAELAREHADDLRQQVTRAIADLECVIKGFDGAGDDPQEAIAYLQDVIAEISKHPLRGVWDSREDAVKILEKLRAIPLEAV